MIPVFFLEWISKFDVNMEMEFTGANNPKLIGVVERDFVTLTGRIRAMMQQTKLSDILKYKLWTGCMKTKTY